MAKRKKQEYKEAIDLIKKIEKATGNRKCIFRGEPSDRFGKVTSNLYRKLGEPEEVLDVKEQIEQTKKLITDLLVQFGEGKRRTPLNEGEFSKVEDELGSILEKCLFIGRRGGAVPEEYRGDISRELHKTYANEAKNWAIDPPKSEVEILTDIQHYGGETNYIDFSDCHLVALFFACYDYNYRERDGHIIVLPKQGLERKSNEGLISQNERFIFSPLSGDNHRVEKQHSVMLYEPEGFLEYEQLKIKPIQVRQGLKRDVLAYLSKEYKISVKTLFPDVHGYIKSQKFVRRSRSLHRQAYVLLRSEKYREAQAVCTSALELNPESSEFYALRAQAYLSLMDHGAADRDVNRALELNDKNPSAYFVRAQIQTGRYRFEEALKDCERAVELGHKEAEVYQLRARIYNSMRRYEEALSHCNRALELSPQRDVFRATLYEVRSQALTGLYRYDEALSDCNRGLKLCGNSAAVCAMLYSARARAYLQQKNHDEALLDCDRSIELGRRNGTLSVALYQTRAQVYESLGRYEEALKDCDCALELTSEDSLFRIGIHFLQVSIYGQWNKLDKVEINLKKALKLAKKINHAPSIELIQKTLSTLNNPNP